MEIALENYININRATMDKHPDLIFLKDKNLRYVYVNEAYLLSNIYSREEILGKINYEFQPVNIDEELRQSDLRVLQTGKSLIYEQQFDHINGNRQNYLVTKSPIFSPTGEIIGLYGSARNIDYQIEIRNDLETNLNLVEILFDSLVYPVFIKDLNGIYIKINSAYASDLKLEVDDIIGKNDYQLFGDELGEFYRSHDLRVLASGKRNVYISTGLRKDVKYITTKDILKDSTGEVIGVIGIVNTYQELSSIRDDLIDMQRIESITQFASGIAHDLNNILTNITLLTSMLLTLEHDEQKKSDLESINSAAHQASDLINKLKTFAQKNPIEKVEIDFNNLVHDTILLLSTKYRRSYNISQHYHPSNPILIGDRTQLSQLIMNLAINGIEAMVSGGTLELSTDIVNLSSNITDYLIHPDNFVGGEHLCLTVKDHGTGIEPQLLNQVFDPYFTTKGENGTGLGLSIVYGVLTAHSGLLKLDTQVGEGSSFFVYLPITNLNNSN